MRLATLQVGAEVVSWGGGCQRASLLALPRGLLAIACEDGWVRVWSIAARACLAVLRGAEDWEDAESEGEVTALAALPGGHLASASEGGVIRVWELRCEEGAP